MKKSILSVFGAFAAFGLHAQVTNTLNNGASTETSHQIINSSSTPTTGGLFLGIEDGPANIGFLKLVENEAFKFFTNNAERMRILNSGEVGLNTIAPTEQFDVDGNARFRQIPTMTTPITGTQFITTHDNTGVLHQIQLSGNSGEALLGDGTFGAVTSGDADWFDMNNAGNAPTSISDDIYTEGNVSIGDDAPVTVANFNITRPTSTGGGLMSRYVVEDRGSSFEEAYTFEAGNSGTATTLTVQGRSAAGIISAEQDNGNVGVQLTSRVAGNAGVGIMLVGEDRLNLDGNEITPVDNAVNLGRPGHTFDTMYVDTKFLLKQDDPQDYSEFIVQTGNIRDDGASNNKHSFVIKPPVGIKPAGSGKIEYDNTHYFSICTNDDSKTLFTIGPKGWTGIAYGGTKHNPVSPSFELDVNGTAWADNQILTSDRRFKKDISDLESALMTISELKGVKYYYDQEANPNKNFTDRLQYGVIAQDIENVLPELVYTNNQGYKAVNYTGFIPFLIEAVKEQQTVIDQQNEKIEALEAGNNSNNELEDLRNELEALKELIAETNNGITLNSIDIWLNEEGKTIYLGQNQPNPFNERTSISYYIPNSVNNARIEIYNMHGELMKSELIERGQGMINIYGENLSQGMYTYSLIADGELIETKKMLIAK